MRANANLPEFSPTTKEGDLLSSEKLNALPHPLRIRRAGDAKDTLWDLIFVCVETGLLKFFVCGKDQRGTFGEVMEIVDINGNIHDADDFYNE